MRTKEQLENLAKDRIPHTGKDNYSHIIIELSEQLLQAIRNDKKEKADEFLAEEIAKLRNEIKPLKDEIESLRKQNHRLELLVDLLETDRDNYKSCY